MQNREGVQKGPQDHAEGGHGAKTRSKILEQLHSGSNGKQSPPGVPEDTAVNSENHKAQHHAAHRLFEARQQHDEAEKNSEKTRLQRQLDRHDIPPEVASSKPVKVVPADVFTKIRAKEHRTKNGRD